MSENPIVVSR